MPRKSGDPAEKTLHPDGSTEQVFDIISLGDSSDSSVVMTGRKSSGRGEGKGKGKASSAVPDVYREMLAEALPIQSGVPDRPLKRRKYGKRDKGNSDIGERVEQQKDMEDDNEDVGFEDVLDQKPVDLLDDEPESALRPQQTVYRESDDSDSASEFNWDDIEIDAKPREAQEVPTGDLELTLKARPAPQSKTTAPRRRVVTQEERVLRLQIHKMHILCLLAYADRRNDWCSDEVAQASLKPLLTKNMITYLIPREDLSQFGRADSLKRGLEDVAKMWRNKFRITESGMRRALWAEDEKDLYDASFPAPSG